MANLGRKNGVFHIRFRFQGKEYKKSLKTGDADRASAAKLSIELTIHRLITGMIVLPNGIDPGDFIVSCGTLLQPRSVAKKTKLLSINQLIDEYLQSQKKFLADSSHSTVAMHLRHLVRHLGDRADAPCDRVSARDLDSFQQTRLAECDRVTVDKERVTVRQFFKWAVTQGYLNLSPAATLAPIKGGEDRPPFRTLAEIARIIERGGLTEEEILDLWECLYLGPTEIAELLAMVRAKVVRAWFVPEADPFALWLVGLTGAGKSFLARLFTNFFGDFPVGSGRFPSWNGTANFLQRQGYYFKDALYLIDDYKPKTTRHPEVLRILQNYSDRAGSGRLKVDATTNTSRPIRGLLISTDEDFPEHTPSAVARNIVVPVPQEEKQLELGLRCQRWSKHYRRMTADFIRQLLAQDRGKHFAFRHLLLRRHFYRDIAGAQNDSRIAGNFALLGATPAGTDPEGLTHSELWARIDLAARSQNIDLCLRPADRVLDSRGAMSSERRASSWPTANRAICAKNNNGDA